MTYVALLRGINVSGQKLIPMAELKQLFEALGFESVTTYIQSGNVVFRSPKKTHDALAKAIAAGIEKKFSFQVPVIVRSLEEMEKILSANPFRPSKLKEGERLHVTLFAAVPAKEGVEKLAKAPKQSDEISLGKSEGYLLVRNGYGTTFFSNNFLEKTLGVKATTRNLETMGKLVEIGKSL